MGTYSNFLIHIYLFTTKRERKLKYLQKIVFFSFMLITIKKGKRKRVGMTSALTKYLKYYIPLNPKGKVLPRKYPEKNGDKRLKGINFVERNKIVTIFFFTGFYTIKYTVHFIFCEVGRFNGVRT